MLCHLPLDMDQVLQHQGQLPRKMEFIVLKFIKLVLPWNINYVHQRIDQVWGRPKVGGPYIAGHLVCELEAGID